MARRRGHELGTSMRGAGIAGALATFGFEPHLKVEIVRLHNCPFHALATRHTTLVCGLNLEFIAGLIDGLGVLAEARLAPRAGACCVELRTAPGAEQFSDRTGS